MNRPAASNKPIVILTSGTRGDIQPLIALGLGLQAAGRPVRFVTHRPFATFIRERGLAYAPLDGDLNALLAAPEWHAALVYDGNPLRNLLTTMRYLQAARPVYARMLQSAWQQAQGASMIIASLPTAAFAGQLAQALGRPCVLALLQPTGPTAAFPSPLLPWTRSLGGRLNRLSHTLIERSLWMPWQTEIKHWRRTALGMNSWPRGGPFAEIQGTPIVYGFSPRIVPPPADWPAQWHTTGYWFVDSPPDADIPANLAHFLATGLSPMYVGFGSMGNQRRADLANIVIAGLRQAGQRAILAFSDLLPVGRVADDLCVVGSIWHDRLFPHVAAVVHHGGAGTTAAALRAGRPSISVPVGIDQWFWGQRIADLGAGSPPIAMRSLTPDRLAAALRIATSTPIQGQAAMLGHAIRSEDGVGRAVATILHIPNT